MTSGDFDISRLFLDFNCMLALGRLPRGVPRFPGVIRYQRRFVRTMGSDRYAGLSRDELVARLQALELGEGNARPGPSTPSPVSAIPASTSPASIDKLKKPKAARASKGFNFAAHATRHIALLISYHGWPYSGLAIQNAVEGAEGQSDEISTVEGELLKALEKTRLIEEGKGWEGCSYSRCGRTDTGVSGAGQVVSLWVRSNRNTPGLGWKASSIPPPPLKYDDKGNVLTQRHVGEHTYPRLLNNVLPPSIRVLGWSPVSDDFDARFSCTLRHYKYAFHLRPTPASSELDLDKMAEGAKLLVGEHDFRNFCKLDGSKQIESHSRRVIDAYFAQDEAYPGMIVFNLIGSAFLWHQVRHVIGVLFLIGSGHESTSLVTELLNAETNPSKPTYQMGDPLPLTLYECGYDPAAGLDWRVGGYDGAMAELPEEDQDKEDEARGRLERNLEELRQAAELRAWQVGNAVSRVKQLYGEPVSLEAAKLLYPVGGGNAVSIGSRYRPVMTRPRGETPDEVNRKWREKPKRNKA